MKKKKLRLQNISVFALSLVSSFFLSCSFLKVVPPDFPSGEDCILVWNEIKDTNGDVDRLKTFDSSYAVCIDQRKPEIKNRVPLEQVVRENYAAKKLDYENAVNKWIDKAYSRLKTCSQEEEPVAQ